MRVQHFPQMNDKSYFCRKRTMPYIIHGFDKCAAINEFLSEDGKWRMSYQGELCVH